MSRNYNRFGKQIIITSILIFLVLAIPSSYLQINSYTTNNIVKKDKSSDDLTDQTEFRIYSNKTQLLYNGNLFITVNGGDNYMYSQYVNLIVDSPNYDSIIYTQKKVGFSFEYNGYDIRILEIKSGGWNDNRYEPSAVFYIKELTY